MAKKKNQKIIHFKLKDNIDPKVLEDFGFETDSEEDDSYYCYEKQIGESFWGSYDALVYDSYERPKEFSITSYDGGFDDGNYAITEGRLLNDKDLKAVIDELLAAEIIEEV